MAGWYHTFRRVTYSTAYLPQIDGLRFLAIFSVVVIMHTSHFLDEKLYGNKFFTNDYWSNFILEGGNGVPLFFTISGFILSLPFARWRLNSHRKPVLRHYYLRRLTRLEPPYIVVLLVLFAAHVWVLGNYTFSDLLPRLIASIFYVHTLVYHSFSRILPISWSLEVEVQFYILAPLFCGIFALRQVQLRRGLMLLVIAASALYWFDHWGLPHLFKYLHYFFAGLLLADLYVSEAKIFPNETAGFIAGTLSLLGFLFLPSIHYLPGYLLKLLFQFVLIYTVLTNAQMKAIFSAKAIVVIGGMCYSIYLLHFAVIAAVGELLQRSGMDLRSPEYFILLMLLLVALVLIVSAVFFLAIEKPFMRRGRLVPENVEKA